jgi:hypothetical protein
MSHAIQILALCGAMAVGTTCAAQAASAPAHPAYHLTDTVVGTVLPQPVIDGPLPFDSTYAALTADQKAVLFDNYESMAPGDEPPYPLYGVRHLVSPLVSYAETSQATGPLVAAVEVDSKGNAVSVTVFKSPDAEMSRIVSGALAFEKYKPAKCHGEPCAMQYVLRLDFPGQHGMPIQEVAFKHYDQSQADFSRR